jgi:hypothetical protein
LSEQLNWRRRCADLDDAGPLKTGESARRVGVSSDWLKTRDWSTTLQDDDALPGLDSIDEGAESVLGFCDCGRSHMVYVAISICPVKPHGAQAFCLTA